MKALLLLLLLLCAVAGGHAQTTPATGHGRRVTVNLLKGEAISGKFLRADAKTVYVEVAGDQVAVSLDEVASLVFSQAEPESPAVKAINALKSLAEAGVGTDHRAYDNRLLEVKSVVDDLLPLIPEGDLREAVSDTLKAFEIVSEIWEQSTQAKPAEEAGKMREDALKTTWSGARKRLQQAEALLKQP